MNKYKLRAQIKAIYKAILEGKAKNQYASANKIKALKKQLNDLEDAARNAGLIDEYMPFNDWYEQVFQNGQMYQHYGNQSAQNSLMGELYAKGYDAIKIPDAGFGGAMSSSWVFEDPSILQKVKAPLSTADQYKALIEQSKAKLGIR